jgi:hypothetical protein
MQINQNEYIGKLPMPETEQPDITPQPAHQPEDERSEIRKFFDKKRNRVVIAVAGVALATISAGFAIGSKVVANNEQQKTTIETTDTGTGTIDLTKTELGKKVEANRSSVERYRSMDISTFDALPIGQRLAYSQFLIDEVTNNGYYGIRYASGEADHDAKLKPVAVTLDSSGQEIIDSYQYDKQMAFLHSITNEDAAFASQKILSSVYYKVGDKGYLSNNYTANKATLTELTIPATMSNILKATNASELRNGVDSETGEAVQYKVVTYTDTTPTTPSKIVYTRFVYHEFTNYDGKPQAVWLNDINADSLDQLNSNGIVK